MRRAIARLLGKRVVSYSYFLKYKKTMQEQLKRKDRLIKELRAEKETWRKTAIKQGERNYELKGFNSR